MGQEATAWAGRAKIEDAAILPSVVIVLITLLGTAALLGAQRMVGVVHLQHVRPNVLTMTLTTTELSALVAGARMALDALRAQPDAVPQAAINTLARTLEDYDRSRARLDQNPAAGGEQQQSQRRRE